MQRSTGRLVGTALAAGLGAVAGSYAAAGATPAFVVAPVESLVVDLTPGVVVLTAIATLGESASLLAVALAVALAVVLGAVPSALAVALADARGRGGWVAAVASAVGVWVVAAAVTGRLLPAIGAGAGAGVVVAASELRPAAGEVTAGRRRLLRTVGSLAGVAGLSVLVGSRSSESSPSRPSDDDVAAAVADRLDEAAEKELDVDGLDPLVTDIGSFYEVDINTFNPTVDPETWELRLTGAVLEEQTLTLADLRAAPVEHRFFTLRCVGDQLNGRKMSTALWGGVPVERFLDRAKPAGTHVMLRAADGYYNEFPIEALEGGMLAYRMNGEPLPEAHGAPVRALIPGHWGEINVKWLTEIEVLTKEREGYWEKRGWHGTGPVNTVAKLWTRNRLDDGRLQVGGLAYAGTRGVARVEVSVDGGRTWSDARLSDPLPDADVWRQWAHEWSPTGDGHEVVVRAVEADGTVQTKEVSTPQPRGATGWVSTTIDR
jgi:DMSO/TMAO reductase YedYZ molybdopterin-dependent catalytic subunit